MKKRIGIIVAIIGLGIFFGTTFSRLAFASSGSINKKWINSIVYQCITGGAVNTPITRGTSGTVADKVLSGGTTKSLPSYDFYGSGSESINCSDAYLKALDYAGRNRSVSFQDLAGTNSLLVDTGYIPNKTETVINIQANVTRSLRNCNISGCDEPYYTANLQSESLELTIIEDGQSPLVVQTGANGSGGGGWWAIQNWFKDLKLSVNNPSKQITIEWSNQKETISWNDKDTTATLIDKINSRLAGIRWGGSWVCVDTETCTSQEARTLQFSQEGSVNSEAGGSFNYESDKVTGANRFLSKISGFNGASALALAEDERAELYTYYVNKAIPNDLQNRFTCDKVDAEYANQEALPIWSGGKWNVRWVDLSVVDRSKTVRDLQTGTSIADITLGEVIDWLKSHGNASDNKEEECVELEGIQVNDGFIEPSRTGGDEMDDQPCFDGGVGSLGWIICPIIKLLRQTTENLYDYVITPFLEIDVGAFDTSSAMFQGWQTFQSFANIVFVIILILVILSQVTGYGIDNYGIKRMLPKIIVGAILVNLSFIICQLLVDISNIVGFSMENMFDNLASQAMSNADGAAVGNNGTAIGATIISGAVGIGGAAAAIYTAEIWLPVIILPLLLGLISIIISCLFMFIILGARRAAAIILVVISPLAFVMYMLPNTRKLFDRWMSAFKAVLLLFPICGLLMGGGAFAGAILWNVSGDFFLGQLLAALTTVIPFFFIPRILKSSLNAVGNLGTTLSNLGNGISRGLGGITKGAIGNSNWYNNMQSNRKDILEERNRNREQERAQRIVDRLKARGGQNDENLTEAQRRRKYRAQATLNRLQREDVEAEAGLTPISRDVELAQAQAKRRQETVNAREDQIRLSGDVDDMDAMRSQLSAAIMDNDDVAIEAYQNVLSGKGEQGRETVHKAMVDAEASGNVSAEARKAYASNIMNGKFANEYKNNSRSTFEFAKANAGNGEGGSMNSYSGSAVNSLTQQKMVDMDEAELSRYRDAMATMSDPDRQTVLNMARDTLNNQRLSQGLKTSQRAVLEEIAGSSSTNNDGTRLNVRDNGANRYYDAAMNRMAAENRRPKNNSNPVNQEGLDQYNDMNDGRA
ncbi:hypothetical protein IJG91_01915 [Candidatus Saccharibacteria bacterium]|nr:hypothetical protein [Candidatus Saccharibacteria bacterium]